MQAARSHSASVGRRRPAQQHQARASSRVRWQAARPRSRACHPPCSHCCQRPPSQRRWRGAAWPVASTKGRYSAQRSACASMRQAGSATSWAGSSLSNAKPAPAALPRRQGPASKASSGGGSGSAAASARRPRPGPGRGPCRARPRGACPRAAARGGRSRARRHCPHSLGRPRPAGPACARAGVRGRRASRRHRAGAAASGCRAARGWSRRAHRHRPAAARGAAGSARQPRPRSGLRAIQNSWNQPMWPSSHSGGLSSARSGTARPGRARSQAAKRASVSARLAASASARAAGPPWRASRAARVRLASCIVIPSSS